MTTVAAAAADDRSHRLRLRLRSKLLILFAPFVSISSASQLPPSTPISPSNPSMPAPPLAAVGGRQAAAFSVARAFSSSSSSVSSPAAVVRTIAVLRRTPPQRCRAFATAACFCTPPATTTNTRTRRRRMSLKPSNDDASFRAVVANERIARRSVSYYSSFGGGEVDDDVSAAPMTPTTEALATLLVRRNQRLAESSSSSEPPPSSSSAVPMRLAMAAAGGGTTASCAIASVPGASGLLMEAAVPYDRRSFAAYCDDVPSVGDGRLLEGVDDDDDDDERRDGVGADGVGGEGSSGAVTSGGEGGGFSFCSPRAAAALGRSALLRSMRCTPTLRQMGGCVGVGCAASLVGADLKTTEESKAYVAVCGMDGDGDVVYDVTLSGESSGAEGEGDETGREEAVVNGEEEHENGMREPKRLRRRNRAEEDRAISNLILLSLLRRQQSSFDDREETESFVASAVEKVLCRNGDRFRETHIMSHGGCEGARRATERIVAGKSDVAVLVPPPPGRTRRRNRRTQAVPDNDDGSDAKWEMQTLPHAVLPPDPLIVPGSFNPPHFGHVALAKAASDAIRRRRAEEATTYKSNGYGHGDANGDGGNNGDPLSEMWDSVEYHDRKRRSDGPTVVFELSVTNADKAPLDPTEAERRVGLFSRLVAQEEDNDVGDESLCLGESTAPLGESAAVAMPKDWGVLLTDAPLFLQKVDVLERCLPPSGGHGHGGGRTMTFVIGTDTMVRILNPKYYGNSVDGMLDAVRDMGRRGVRFVVGGRLEQGKAAGEQTKFITGEEELASLPPDVRGLFIILREEDFRVDVSSTELRAALQKESSARLLT